MLFFHIGLHHCPAFSSIHINLNTRLCMILAFVSNDTFLFLVIFPNSSIAVQSLNKNQLKEIDSLDFLAVASIWIDDRIKVSKIFNNFDVLLSVFKFYISFVVIIFVTLMFKCNLALVWEMKKGTDVMQINRIL